MTILGGNIRYHPNDDDGDDSLRHVAQIAYINADGTVNLGILNEHGVSYNEQHVYLCEPGETCSSGMCEWAMISYGQDEFVPIDDDYHGNILAKGMAEGSLTIMDEEPNLDEKVKEEPVKPVIDKKVKDKSPKKTKQTVETD